MLLRSWLFRSRVGDSQERSSPTYHFLDLKLRRLELVLFLARQPPCTKLAINANGRIHHWDNCTM